MCICRALCADKIDHLSGLINLAEIFELGRGGRPSLHLDDDFVLLREGPWQHRERVQREGEREGGREGEGGRERVNTREKQA